MRLSKDKLAEKTKKEIFASFYQLMADLSSPEEGQEIFGSLLSAAEQIAIAKRIAILWALHQGKKYSQIRDKFHISPATIAKLQDKIDESGIKKMFKHMEAEKWASQWEQKIKGFFTSKDK